jgi:hypothetical protein
LFEDHQPIDAPTVEGQSVGRIIQKVLEELHDDQHHPRVTSFQVFRKERGYKVSMDGVEPVEYFGKGIDSGCSLK